MFGVLLAIVFPAILYGILKSRPWARGRMTTAIMSAYGARMVLQTFLRDFPFFQHGVGGDNVTYELLGTEISMLWRVTGIHYVTELGDDATANVFGFIIYVNGEPTRLGCTTLIAFLACLTCLNLYHLATSFGADKASSSG